MPRVNPGPAYPHPAHYATLWLLVAVFVAGAMGAAFSGCTSPGDQYQASAITFATVVDVAAELRKADKLEPDAVWVIDSAITEGQAILHAWALALRADRPYPDGVALVASVVSRIRQYFERE